MIHEILVYSVKALICFIGAMALYCACFLYPDEENKLQNKIEEFWISIDERRRMGQSLALASKVARLINRGLDRILGQNLISIRMIIITCCYSLACLEIWEFYMFHEGMLHATIHGYPIGLDLYLAWYIYRYYISNILLLLLTAIMASKYEKQPVTVVAATLLGYGLWVQQLNFASDLAIIFVLSMAADLLCLLGVRFTLRMLVESASLPKSLIGLSFQLALIYFSLILPWRKGKAEYSVVPDAHGGVSVGFTITKGFILFGLNTSTGIISVVFLSVLLFLVSHKLTWPTLSRLLHPLARFEIIRNRKVLVLVAVMCFTAVSPPVAGLLKKGLELFK